MKVIVCGTRDCTDASNEINLASELGSLDHYYGIDEIIHGACPNSADTLARVWAEEKDVEIKEFPADWETFKKFAGFKRNAEMAKYAADSGEYCMTVALWDGKSNGTRNMIEESVKAGIPVRVVPAKML